MILVAGGTGTLGRVLVAELVAKGLDVRVMTRDPARADAVRGPSVEVVVGDVRDHDSVGKAAVGARTVISSVQGFVGPGGVTPVSVDRNGNANLVEAAARTGADFVLISAIGPSPDHPWELIRAKYDAEQNLQASGVPWTIVRPSAFTETWGSMMLASLKESGRITVFGRGDSLQNYVSVIDVAPLVARAAEDPTLRGQVLEIGGPDNLTFNQLARIVQEVVGFEGKVRHVPRAALRLTAVVAGPLRPELARMARAALFQDTVDGSFDAIPLRRDFPNIPLTDVRSALARL